MLLTLISHSSDLILHASSTTSTFTTSVPVFDRPQSQHPKMAKHSDWWKASQLEKKRNARRDLCQEWGYDADAHWQKDAEQTRGRASMKTKERYRERMCKYKEYVSMSFECKPLYSHSSIRFLIKKKNMPEDYKIGEGHPAPTLKKLKEFIHWLIESTEDRLASNEWSTVHTILVQAQEFVLGSFLETGNEISSHDWTNLYYVSSLCSLEWMLS